VPERNDTPREQLIGVFSLWGNRIFLERIKMLEENMSGVENQLCYLSCLCDLGLFICPEPPSPQYS
jgi:hypothetical protein